MSIWMPLVAILMGQTAPTAEAEAEAEALGVRLAETGTLAALLPAIVAKDREALVAEHPELNDAEKAALGATADGVAKAGLARLTAAIGHGYAAKLSVEDLRTLVVFNESPAARHWREATPAAVMQALAAVGDLNFQADTRKAFCAKTGELCGE